MKDIVLPDGVQIIGKSCFEGCAVAEITIPQSVRTVHTKAFSKCKQLKHVSLPDGLQTIEESAFAKTDL